MKTDNKFKKFKELARLLNDRLNVVPLLYGSLGLEVLTGDKFDADDVDILIPKKYIFEDWTDFKALLEGDGYTLIDLHEHTFEKCGIAFAFAHIEAVEEYAGISESDIETITENVCKYKLLSLKQYLAVYEKSVCDGYRISNGKNQKDIDKVKYIRDQLLQSDA